MFYVIWLTMAGIAASLAGYAYDHNHVGNAIQASLFSVGFFILAAATLVSKRK